jgi:hypothetical protein
MIPRLRPFPRLGERRQGEPAIPQPVGIVTTGAIPFSPVSTRVKTNIKKEKILLDPKSRSSIQKYESR